MPFSHWAMPDVPDVDLATFALRHAVRLADRPALIDGERVMTYAELAERVHRAAGALAGRDVVAVRLPNSSDFAVLLLGALRAGAAVTPVSPLYTEREVADQLRLTGAELVTEAAGPARPLPDVDPGAVALMLSSSGTTGLPKIVQLTHRAEVSNLCQTAELFPYREGERVLGLAPFFHSMGLCVVLLHALASGATVVTMPRFDLEGMLRTIERHGVSQVLIPPPVLKALAHAPVVDSFDLSSLRVVGCGGAPATAELERAAAERLDCVVGQGYGITEAGPMVAIPRSTRRASGTARPVCWCRAPRPRSSTARSGCAGRSSCAATSATPRRPRRRSTRTAGCTPATSAASTTTATSTWATASRS